MNYIKVIFKFESNITFVATAGPIKGGGNFPKNYPFLIFKIDFIIIFLNL